MRKDVLPTNKQSNIIYQFECRQCESRYVGRTLQHLDARIRQHVPLSLLSSEQRASRPRRGRPSRMKDGKLPEGGAEPDLLTKDDEPSNGGGKVSASVKEVPPDSGVKRRGRPRKVREDENVDKKKDVRRSKRLAVQCEADGVKQCVELCCDDYVSSIAKHLVSSDECRRSYADDSFSVLSHVRSLSHLKVLEAVYISSTCPVLCKQKEFVVRSLQLFVKTQSSSE